LQLLKNPFGADPGKICEPGRPGKGPCDTVQSIPAKFSIKPPKVIPIKHLGNDYCVSPIEPKIHIAQARPRIGFLTGPFILQNGSQDLIV